VQNHKRGCNRNQYVGQKQVRGQRSTRKEVNSFFFL